MPAALALPAFWGAVGAAGAGTAAIVSGHEQAGAAQDAAKLQTDAANHAADVQAQSAANALAFQKQQAAQDLANANAVQRANYQQWAAKRQALNALGAKVGAAPQQIPAYVPLTSVAGMTTNGLPTGQPVMRPSTPTERTPYQTTLSNAGLY